MNGIGIICGTVTKQGTSTGVDEVRVKAKASGIVWDKDRTDEDGDYRLTVPWGQYVVKFIHKDCACQNVTQNVTVLGVPVVCDAQLACP